MDGKKYYHKQRENNTVQNIEPEERILPSLGSSQQHELDVVIRPYSQLRSKRPLDSEERRRRGHLCPHGNRPECKLVPWQQIAGPTEQERQHQKQYPDNPVKFPRRLIGAGQEDPRHMHPYSKDHPMGRQPVHISECRSKGNDRHDIFNILIGASCIRDIVEHQEDPGYGKNHKEEKGCPSHTPGISDLYGLSSCLNRMEVVEDIAEGRQRPVARRIFITMTEYGLPEWGAGHPIGNPVHQLTHRASLASLLSNLQKERLHLT